LIISKFKVRAIAFISTELAYALGKYGVIYSDPWPYLAGESNQLVNGAF